MTVSFDYYGNSIPAYRARLGAGGVFAIALAVLLNVTAAAGLIWVAVNQQRVTDQLVVWNFEPGTDIESYSDRVGFTDEGRFLFYASRPAITAGESFDEVCGSHKEDIGILGCYRPFDRTIFLFDVTDDRLDGIEEVVAAHEMLHAAWARMGETERARIGALLETEAAKLLDYPGFAETMDFYARAEPGQRQNELHSILGTEFRELSPELEAHYARYFVDRGVVVALHETSNAVFTEQAAALATLTAQIEGLAASIEADYASYNAGYDGLNADIESFNSRASSGSFETQAEFDAERNALVARQADLDTLYSSIDARVAQYDGLLAQLEALNATSAALNEAINITPRDTTETTE